MFVLGIETSAGICSIAWLEDSVIALEYTVEQPNVHTRLIADLVDKGFKELNRNATQLDLISVSSGPGSFTGLRIGMAYAKGMAFALEKPIVDVSNFEVLAHHSIRNKYPIYSIIDARRNNYFIGVFKKNNLQITKMEFCNYEELTSMIEKEGVIITTIPDFDHKINTESDIIITRFSASSVAQIGEIKFAKGYQSDLEELEPLYVRKFIGAG